MLLVRFEWGTPDARKEMTLGMRQAPRVDELVEIEEGQACYRVQQVIWTPVNPATNKPDVLVRLRD